MEDNRDILPIKLNIQGIGKSPYSFVIKRGDEYTEMVYREAEKLVNKWMSRWASEMINGDIVDRLAMTALSIAMESVQKNNRGEQDAETAALEGRALSQRIDDYLNKL